MDDIRYKRSCSSSVGDIEVTKSSISNIDDIYCEKSSSSNYFEYQRKKSSCSTESKKSSSKDAACVKKNSLVQDPDVHATQTSCKIDAQFSKMATAIANVVNSNSNGGKNVASHLGDRDLPTFWGEPETWINFHRQLKKSTELCGCTEEENILRLQKKLRGKAKEAVESLLVTSCSFDEIIGTLEKRFGRPQMIMKFLIQKARSVAAPN